MTLSFNNSLTPKVLDQTNHPEQARGPDKIQDPRLMKTELLSSIRDVKQNDDFSILYQNLLTGIPQLHQNECFQLLASLPKFLEFSKAMLNEQKALAESLGDYFLKFAQSSDDKILSILPYAVDLYVKSRKIAVKMTDQSSIERLETKISEIILDLIRKKTANPLSTLPPFVKYQQALRKYREVFGKMGNYPDVRSFQKDAVTEFIFFFNTILDDTFSAAGPVPCGFDFRAMGSLAKQESCPFSDIEPLILIESMEHVDYFKEVIQILTIQIHMLGEGSPTEQIASLEIGEPNINGLHLDGGSYIYQLIKTPTLMAQLQDGNQGIDNASGDYMKLRSLGIRSNDISLYQDYQKQLSTYFDSLIDEGTTRRKRSAVDSIIYDLENVYKHRWAHPFSMTKERFDIKNEFIQAIGYLISNIGFYFDIKCYNTIDIVQELVEKQIFHSHTGQFLTKALEKLFKVRVRLHLHYGEQNDCAYNPSYAGDLKGFRLTTSEMQDLEQCYEIAIYTFYESFKEFFRSQKSKERRTALNKALEIQLHNYDLFKECLLLSVRTKKEILAITKYQMSYEKHEEYYNILANRSGNDELRRCYLEQVEPNLKDRLALIPDMSGFRQSTREKEIELNKALLAMTKDSPPPGNCKVAIKMIGWDNSRYLSQEVIKQVIDPKTGRIQKSYAGSAHRVSKAEFASFDLHFKDLPSHPLMEYAIFDLTSRLYPDLTPPNELIRFDVELGSNKITYPVLISKTFEGKDLKKFEEADEKSTTKTKMIDQINWSRCNQQQWTWMLLASILTSPGDGRSANYIVASHSKSAEDAKYTIHCIDNDISFVKPIEKSGLWRNVNFCCAPFCFFLNNKLDRSALLAFCHLDVGLILNGWINQVIAKEQQYLGLFSEAEQRRLYQEEQQQFKATILFRQGTLATLKMQFLHLKNYIANIVQIGGDITSGDLLRQIISLRKDSAQNVGSYIYDTYDKAIRFTTLSKRLEAVSGRVQDKSLTSAQADRATLGVVPSFEEIKARKSYSPTEAKQELASIVGTRGFQINNISGGIFVKIDCREIDTPIREEMIFKSIPLLIPKPVAITLIYCKSLTPAILQEILHKDLISLDLSFCKRWDPSFLDLIQKTCPALSEFNLTGCEEITTFTSNQGLFKTSEPLDFTNLKILKLDQCPKLKQIKLRAPILEFLTAKRNEELEIFQLENRSEVKVYLTKCPKLPFEILRKYKHTFLKILENGDNSIDDLPASMYQDEDILLAAARQFPWVIKYVPNNKKAVIKAVQKDGLFLDLASPQLKDDKEVVLHAVRKNGLALQYASSRLKNDEEVVITAVTQHPAALVYASQSIKENEEIVIEAVKRNGLVLGSAGEKLKENKNVVIHAIKQNGLALMDASENLKKDKEIALEAILQNQEAKRHVSKELLLDKKFIFEAVTRGYPAWEFVDEKFWDDRQLVLAAVKQNPKMLLRASERLHYDTEIVFEAIKRDASLFNSTSQRLKEDKNLALIAVGDVGEILGFLSIELRDDFDVVLKAVQKSGKALRYASSRLIMNREIIVAAIAQCGSMLAGRDVDIKADKDIVLLAVNQDGLALQYAAEKLHDDRDVVLAAVRQNGLALEYPSKRLRGDKEIVFEAIREFVIKWEKAVNQNSYSEFTDPLKQSTSFPWDFMDEELRTSRDFILQIVSIYGNYLSHSNEYIRNDRVIVLEAVKQNCKSIEYASGRLKNDKEIALLAIKQNWEVVKYLDRSKIDKEIILTSVQKNWYALLYFSEELKFKLGDDLEIVTVAFKQNFAALDYASDRVQKIILADKKLALESLKTSSYRTHRSKYTKRFFKDQDLILQALEYRSILFSFVSKKLKNNREFVTSAVEIQPRSICYASRDLQEDREFILNLIGKVPAMFEYLSISSESSAFYPIQEMGYSDDKEIVLKAVTKDGLLLKYASTNRRRDKEVVLAAVKQNPQSLQFASQKLQEDKEMREFVSLHSNCDSLLDTAKF